MRENKWSDDEIAMISQVTMGLNDEMNGDVIWKCAMSKNTNREELNVSTMVKRSSALIPSGNLKSKQFIQMKASPLKSSNFKGKATKGHE